MKIKVCTSHNEHHDISRFTTFKVVDEKPEVQAEFDRQGTRIVEVSPVHPDLSSTNIYADDDAYYELWECTIALDEEDESDVAYEYVAVRIPDEGEEDTDGAEAVAKKMREASCWDEDLCEKLCELAGLKDEWDASDGDTFENVVFKAAEKLGVEID